MPMYAVAESKWMYINILYFSYYIILTPTFISVT